MSAAQAQFKVNIPMEVKEWLAEEASKNMRSQTAEIVLALKEKMIRQGVKSEQKGAAPA